MFHCSCEIIEKPKYLQRFGFFILDLLNNESTKLVRKVTFFKGKKKPVGKVEKSFWVLELQQFELIHADVLAFIFLGFQAF